MCIENREEAIRCAKGHFIASPSKDYRVYVTDKNGNIVFIAERINGKVTKCWEAQHENKEKTTDAKAERQDM